jgi:MFS family permease
MGRDAGMPATTEQSTTRSTGRKRVTELLFATVSQGAVSFTQQGIIVLGVFFASTYRLTLTQMASVVSTVTLGWMLGGLFMGSLVDRFGPRAVVLVGTLAMAGVTTTIGATWNFSLTWVLLFALGLCVGAAPSAGTKAVLLEWPLEHRGLPMGVRQMGVPAGALIAAAILPTLAMAYGLHPMFWTFAGALLVCGLGFYLVLPSRAVRATATRAHGRSLRAELGGLTLPAVCGFLMVWGQYVLLTYTIPMLRDLSGFSIALAGAALATAQAGGACARIVLGAISDRLGGRRELVLSRAAIVSMLLALVVALVPAHASAVLLFPLWFCLGCAMVGWNALLVTWAGERVSVGNAGAAMSLTTSAVLFGATVSTPVFGRIVEMSHSYHVAWLTLAVITGLAALLLWRETRRARRLPRHSRQESPLAV